ncbi:MAG TPA: tetratricopeptide repeat protein [Longimicrobiaceae bacterium]
MRVRSGLVLTLAAGLVLGGCAAGAAGGGGGPAVSPTGKTYPPGTRPTESRFTTPAKLYIAQGQFQRALEEAQRGLAADSTNPQHYFLVGQAQAGLGDFEAADAMFDRAEQIYPAYELEVEPAREAAWADAFNQGVTAYNAGNVQEATVAWEKANRIYSLRPEAYQNLAAVYTQANDYPKAIEAYRGGLAALEATPAARALEAEEVTERAEAKTAMRENLAELLLFTDQHAEAEALYREQLAEDTDNVALRGKLAAAIAAQPGRAEEAQAIYNELLGRSDLDAATLMEIGVVLFQQKDFARAGEAFRRVTEARPNSRDAWYNYANALYAAENWQPLVTVAERLVQLDPLNYDASLILARAYRDVQQNDKALAELERMDAVPVQLGQMETRQGAGRTTVRGQVTGKKAAAGTPIQLRFTFFGENGAELGTEMVTVTAPAPEATSNFEVVLESETPAVGYRYERVN